MEDTRDFHIDLCLTTLLYLHNQHKNRSSHVQTIAPIYMNFEKLMYWYDNLEEELRNRLFEDVSNLKACIGYENFYKNVVTQENING